MVVVGSGGVLVGGRLVVVVGRVLVGVGPSLPTDSSPPLDASSESAEQATGHDASIAAREHGSLPFAGLPTASQPLPHVCDSS